MLYTISAPIYRATSRWYVVHYLSSNTQSSVSLICCTLSQLQYTEQRLVDMLYTISAPIRLVDMLYTISAVFICAKNYPHRLTSEKSYHKNTVCLKKPRPLRLIGHNITNSQHLLSTFGRRRPYSIFNWLRWKFLNWLRTSCAVSMTTVATWRSVSQKNRNAMNTTFWHNLIKRSLIEIKFHRKSVFGSLN